MKRALLFPGQGSQAVGMGKELAEASQAARRTFEEADDLLGISISKLCFEGPSEDLDRTENGQPAILTCSIAALRALEEAKGPLEIDFAAGHSLGEYTALVAAGALRFADAVRLVRLRGRAMQEAVPEGKGTMAAILGLEGDVVAEVCQQAAAGEVCQPANFNGGGQVVISGHTGAVERAMALAKERGAKRAVQLKVSAPFHSTLMQPAADRMKQALAETEISPLNIPVISNVEATPNRDAARVTELLIEQITGSVLWEQSMLRLAQEGVTRAYEVGHNVVLRGLCKRITPDIVVSSIGKPADVAGAEV